MLFVYLLLAYSSQAHLTRETARCYLKKPISPLSLWWRNAGRIGVLSCTKKKLNKRKDGRKKTGDLHSSFIAESKLEELFATLLGAEGVLDLLMKLVFSEIDKEITKETMLCDACYVLYTVLHSFVLASPFIIVIIIQLSVKFSCD